MAKKKVMPSYVEGMNGKKTPTPKSENPGAKAKDDKKRNGVFAKSQKF